MRRRSPSISNLNKIFKAISPYCLFLALFFTSFLSLPARAGEIQAKSYHHIPMSHSGEQHFVNSISYSGDRLELHDGSLWEICPFDQSIVRSWYAEDLITITSPSYSFYDYQLQNHNTGERVEANLITTPILFGTYSFWITDIEGYSNQVLLNDGSLWLVHPADLSKLFKWALNDHVIIGTNSGYAKNYYPHLLIDSNTNTFIRAACLN